MDERASLPVTLPRANPTTSYWQDPPDPELADLQSTESLPKEADVVIIGSGITGSATAYNLYSGTSPPGKVVMLESRQACSGATGRNGGHTKAASYRSFLSNASSLGTAAAVKIARFEYETIRSQHEFIRVHSIPCDACHGDTVDIIYSPTQWADAHTAIKALQTAMPDELEGAAKYTFWSAEEAREKFSVKGEEFCGAVSYEAGSLSAYAFVVGVLKLCLQAGLQLYTHTPVTSLSKTSDGPWSVKTEKGSINAKRVVLATNGYTAALLPQFQGSIVPLRGQITAHRPGSSMPKGGLGVTYSFSYVTGYEYMIPRPQGSKYAGDIIIGGGLAHASNEGLEEYGNTDDTCLNPKISSYLFNTTPRYFGASWGDDDPAGRIRKEWTGVMGYSPDGFPFVGPVPGEANLWIAASFQGHGMVLAWSCARALVAMMNGDDAGSLSWFPEAFRVTEERMEKRFAGRLHAKDVEEGS